MSNSKNEIKSSPVGLRLIIFIAGVAGIAISFSLLKEDVLSTAHTLYEFFPSRFSVIPSTTFDGAWYLGLFISATQIVTGYIVFSKEFNWPVRYLSILIVMFSVPFDSWTDIGYRSGYFTGDLLVAVITTLGFYTFGSEIMQTLSWLVVITTWRGAVSDFLWIWARLDSGLRTLKAEKNNFFRAARRLEDRELEARRRSRGDYESVTVNSPPREVEVPIKTILHRSPMSSHDKDKIRKSAKDIVAATIDNENLSVTTYNAKMEKAASMLDNIGDQKFAREIRDLKITDNVLAEEGI